MVVVVDNPLCELSKVLFASVEILYIRRLPPILPMQIAGPVRRGKAVCDSRDQEITLPLRKRKKLGQMLSGQEHRRTLAAFELADVADAVACALSECFLGHSSGPPEALE